MGAQAAALYSRGLERFGAHDYAGATADFEAGFALEPRREFLFAEAQAKRLAGDCPGAVVLYQRFLATTPAPVQANAAQIALGRCAQHLAEHPKVVVVAPPPPPRAPPPPPPRWWRDPLGIGLGAGALVGLGIGAGFAVAANGARDDAHAATSLAEYDRHWSTAESRRAIAIGSLSVGVALGVGAATRFAAVRRRARAQEAAITAVTVSIGAGAIGVGGRF